MHNKNPHIGGFTIVELLVVVVVVAILAAITIVSYSGISNRANDTVVQSDISSMSKKLQIYLADQGTYPDTNFESQVSKAFEGLRASKNSYVTSGTLVNLVYCTNLPDKTQYAVVGWSKSSSTKGFYISNSVNNVREFNYAISAGGDSTCDKAGIGNNRAWMWMYDVNVSGGWRSFI